jgi:hypothetical protein
MRVVKSSDNAVTDASEYFNQLCNQRNVDAIQTRKVILSSLCIDG